MCGGQEVADVSRNDVTVPAIGRLNPEQVRRPIGSDAAGAQSELNVFRTSSSEY